MQIGRRLKGGEVIVLHSDLGGGKTSFIRGLAQGMGSKDVVRSPSFTVAHQYRAGNLMLHHFDFYRLVDPGILRDELREVLQDEHAVVAIEWADIVTDILPVKHLTIHINATGETTRLFKCMYPDSLMYLIPTKT